MDTHFTYPIHLRKLAFLGLAISCCFHGNGQTDSFSEKANSIFEDIITNSKIVGFSASVVRNDSVLWKKNYGFSNLKRKVSFTNTTLTRTASISKPMTAIAVMQLLEKGKIKLEDPIQKYIPDFPLKKEGAFTIQNLLSHSSGISGYGSPEEYQSKQEFKTLQEAVNVFKDRDLKFTPGVSFYYSTYGYVVLGLLIEKVSGMSYKNYMRKNIWDKAGMQNTGIEKFVYPYKNKSQLYYLNDHKLRNVKPNNLSNRAPGGGMYTTLNDMLKFGNAILTHKLIQKETFDLMTESHFIPENDSENGYGLGWFLYGPKLDKDAIIGHSGEQLGATNQFALIPKDHITIVILTNTSGANEYISDFSWQLTSLIKNITD